MRVGQSQADLLKGRNPVLPVLSVKVSYNEFIDLACRYSRECIGPPLPPKSNNIFVGGRILEPVGRQRRLGFQHLARGRVNLFPRTTRKDGQAQLSERKGTLKVAPPGINY